MDEDLNASVNDLPPGKRALTSKINSEDTFKLHNEMTDSTQMILCK